MYDLGKQISPPADNASWLELDPMDFAENLFCTPSVTPVCCVLSKVLPIFVGKLLSNLLKFQTQFGFVSSSSIYGSWSLYVFIACSPSVNIALPVNVQFDTPVILVSYDWQEDILHVPEVWPCWIHEVEHSDADIIIGNSRSIVISNIILI